MELQDDKKMEIALCEFEEIIVRSVLHKSKVSLQVQYLQLQSPNIYITI